MRVCSTLLTCTLVATACSGEPDLASPTDAGALDAQPVVDWVEETPAGLRPPALDGVYYDPARALLVGLATTTAEIWEWNGIAWSVSAEPGIAGGLSGFGITYESARNAVVAFGGFTTTADGPQPPSGRITYVNTDGTWNAQRPSPAPTARWSPLLAHDPVREHTLLFGGVTFSDGDGSPLDDTWTWDGTTWSELHPATHPSALTFAAAAIAYDADRDRTVLVGSSVDLDPMPATWEWDGTTWTAVAATGPSARHSTTLVYDPARHATVLVGGHDGDNNHAGSALRDSWAWDGTSWHRLAALLPPDLVGVAARDPRGGITFLSGERQFHLAD